MLGEPTNDLDTDTLAALEDLLDTWPGTLVVVSHDRYLIERVTDDVVAVFGDGRITHLPGGVDEYLRRRQVGGAGRLVPEASTPLAGPGTAAPSGASRAGVQDASLGVAGVDGGPSAGELRVLRKELQRLERQLESLRRKESNLHDRLATLGADYAAAAEADRELRAVTGELADVEERWLTVAERIEG